MKRITISSIIVLAMLGIPTAAMAMMDGSGTEHGGDGESGHHGNAPEPVTILGLALGAGGIAAAGWRARRAAARKRQ
jgi:hypothetical protein